MLGELVSLGIKEPDPAGDISSSGLLAKRSIHRNVDHGKSPVRSLNELGHDFSAIGQLPQCLTCAAAQPDFTLSAQCQVLRIDGVDAIDLQRLARSIAQQNMVRVMSESASQKCGGGGKHEQCQARQQQATIAPFHFNILTL